MTKHSYYAITAIHETTYYNQGEELHGLDWHILSGPHASHLEAEKAGRDQIGEVTNIIKQTQYKNLMIVSKSELRHFRIRLDAEI